MDQYNSADSTGKTPSYPVDHPLVAELVDRPRRPILPWIAGAFIILVIAGVVIGPLIYLAWPGEMVRWRIASAEEKRLNGDLDGAIADLSNALKKKPNDYQLLRKRAQWRIEQQDYAGAFNDLDRVVKLRPLDIDSYYQRSQALQYLGRHREAVADWKHISEMEPAQSTRMRATVLNGLAYARALANIEIDEALVDIDEALRRAGESYDMIDTRGYLYFRQGDYDRALQDLNRAVENAEEDYSDWLARTKPGGFGLPDPREQKLEAQQHARHLAVIYYHRGLVHQAMGQDESAQKDFDRVRELGCEPNDQLF